MSDSQELARDAAKAANEIVERSQIDLWELLRVVGAECESAIEQKLLMSLVASCWPYAYRLDVSAPRHVLRLRFAERELKYELFKFAAADDRPAVFKGRTKAAAVIETQVPIGRWRVDFVVSLIFPVGEQQSKVAKLVVECDGHDYHERTKEQAKKDKSRDRDLKIMGHDVFRFTGSEIWSDADGCAKQVVDFLEAQKPDAGAVPPNFPKD